MDWTVGQVTDMFGSRGGLGSGFAIFNPHRAPLATFMYRDHAAAEAARKHIEAAMAKIVDFASYPDPNRD